MSQHITHVYGTVSSARHTAGAVAPLEEAIAEVTARIDATNAHFMRDNALDTTLADTARQDEAFWQVSDSRASWKDGRATVATDANRHHDSFHPDPRDVDRAAYIIEHALSFGGATCDRAYDYTPHTSGYYVAGKWHDVSYRVSHYTPRELATLLHKYVVSSPTFPGLETYIGLWVNDGRLYFGTVTHHERAGDAVETGLARNQAAIYDIACERNVYLDVFR